LNFWLILRKCIEFSENVVYLPHSFLINVYYIKSRLHYYFFVLAIVIQFLGVAKTSWSETETVRHNDGNTGNEVVTFTATEEYFSNKYNLAGGPNSRL
jgi:hypothetical protein